jgi:hypothetical protein
MVTLWLFILDLRCLDITMEVEVNWGKGQCAVTVVLQGTLWISVTSSMAFHLATSPVAMHMLPIKFLYLKNHTCLLHKLNANNCLPYCLPRLLYMQYLHLKLHHLRHLSLRLLHPLLIKLPQLLLSSCQVYTILFSQISFLDIQSFLSSLHNNLSCLKMNGSLIQEPLITWCTPYQVSLLLLLQFTVIFTYLMDKEC